MPEQSILPEFATHLVTEEGLKKIADVRAHFSTLLRNLDAVFTGEASGLHLPTRERALMVTKLQEACMFAVRNIAVDPGNQERTPR